MVADVDAPGVDLADPRTAYLLTLADDELVMGHRESFWIGIAPSLEEDIAFAGISQDEINHADVWYQLIVGDDRAAVDALALGRTPEQYRHAVLVERRSVDFADTLARHWFYDHFDTIRLTALAGSTDPEVGAVARKLAHEERYHVQHADALLQRIARDDAAAVRLRTALDAVVSEAHGLFEPLPEEQDLLAAGVTPVASRDLHARWVDEVSTLLTEAGMGALPGPREPVDPTVPGGRRGRHTTDWTEDAWPEMTRLHREFAGARW